MGLILEAMATRGRTPSQLLQEVPQYVMIKKKFDMSATQTHRVLEGLRRHDWGGEVTVNLLDGVRLDWPDRWALIRSSNTEPVIRIAAEAKTPAGAEELIERLYKLAMTF
jgi:phosphomannomutase